MPLVLGAAAIAFVFLTLLTLFYLHYYLQSFSNWASGIPIIGGAIANFVNAFIYANLVVIRQVYGVAHAVVRWGIDQIHEGFKLLHDLQSAAERFLLRDTINNLANLSGTVLNYVIPGLYAVQFRVDDLEHWVNGFAKANIDALFFWRAKIIDFNETFVIPNIHDSVARLTVIETIALPQLSGGIKAINGAVLDLINTIVKPMRQDLADLSDNTATTLRAPGTGVLPRLDELEGQMAQVLPWAAAIGLSIPLARSLARVGRNPCTCLEEQGQTDMLPLLVYLFEEAG